MIDVMSARGKRKSVVPSPSASTSSSSGWPALQAEHDRVVAARAVDLQLPVLDLRLLDRGFGGFVLAAPSAVAIPAPATDAAIAIAAIAGQITRMRVFVGRMNLCMVPPSLVFR